MPSSFVTCVLWCDSDIGGSDFACKAESKAARRLWGDVLIMAIAYSLGVLLLDFHATVVLQQNLVICLRWTGLCTCSVWHVWLTKQFDDGRAAQNIFTKGKYEERNEHTQKSSETAERTDFTTSLPSF